ncbi:quinolinate synthase NadA [Simkania negevensis]|uniref:Quinolinate synthase n=1 Tax=Simkania negevensis (strain ATCC VR-1471 / DSM 27360 / Z) TaxID=331113 RepID=F8L4V5_SIMNZ|nr:quinolinate synthase NadA [Simkania negevensis]CCB88832.1 quinolinate synthase A 1 [Simkania negevensis Z]
MTTLYEKLKNIQVDNPLCNYTKERCERLEPLIEKINKLKAEKNALILAHSYVHPDIIYGVADHVGDSYGLAQKAKITDAEIIVFPAVRFMAETAKILNPQKTVIDPNPNGGCSLADSITADQVLALRLRHPDHTFVCYINTTAAVKAACDVCVTSSNVYTVIKNLPTKKVFFLPDKLMGENILNYMRENNIDKELLVSDGTCYVHEEFSCDEIHFLKQKYPDLEVLAHPECTQEVINASDVTGSTSQILNYVKSHKDENHPFLILTECGITSRLQVEHPELRLVGTCMMCKYMKSNSLSQILQALEAPTKEQIITIDPAIQDGALACVNQMFRHSH